MKPLQSIFLIFVFINSCAFAQTSISTYKFQGEIAAEITKDTTAWKYQTGATAFSISGYYQSALDAWDKNGAGITVLNSEDSIYLKTFYPRNAKEYIIERSATEKVIIINEAHHNSRHRAFTHSLLKELYNNGFRYLGLEALSDTMINIRKFPVMESGYYTREPEFGNLLSAALNAGFILFGYEASEGKNGNEREIEQAENISGFMAKHPDGKFLIHCGYDHVTEGDHKRWGKAMAGRLKEFSKTDPFTVDQVRYSEKGDQKYNNPCIEMFNLKYPVVLSDKAGIPFNGTERNDKTDCAIIHPVTEYINERPDWLTAIAGRKWYKFPASKITELPVLVLAFRSNEFGQNGVPSDIIEITRPDKTGYLVLSEGRYDIIIVDKNHKIIGRYQEEIK